MNIIQEEHTPAFPNQESDRGLTKLQYAAIHCAEPIPQWFEPQMQARKPKHPGRLSELFGKNGEHPNREYFKYYDDELGRFLTNADLEGTTQQIPEIPESFKLEVKRHIQKLRRYERRIREWNLEYYTQRARQWRYYFAHKLLE